VPEDQPLINSIGIALANNECPKIFKKGRGLPLKDTRDYRTVHLVRQGQTGELIKIPIIEGENDLADRNRRIGELLIKAEKIQRDLPAGSELEVTLRIEKSGDIIVTAYVPFLDEEFTEKIELRHKNPDAEFLKKDFENEMRRLRDVKAKAASTEGETAEQLVQQVEASPLLQEIKELLPAIKGDPNAAAKFEKRLLELKLILDEAINALEWPALISESREKLGELQKVADQDGNEQQRRKAEDFADDVEEIISERKPEQLRKKIEQMTRLYYEIVMAQPGWWVSRFQLLEKQQQKMTDQSRAARLFDQGRECIAKNNFTGLQNVVRQLWELLPNDEDDGGPRGYGATIMPK